MTFPPPWIVFFRLPAAAYAEAVGPVFFVSEDFVSGSGRPFLFWRTFFCAVLVGQNCL